MITEIKKLGCIQQHVLIANLKKNDPSNCDSVKGHIYTYVCKPSSLSEFNLRCK